MTETQTALTNPLEIEQAVSGAKRAFPDAEIKVRRGRLIAVTGDVIELISVRRQKEA